MKTYTIHQKMSLGEIVSAVPKSADILKNYKIDFCCGGHRSLEEAAYEKGMNPETLIGEINGCQKETNYADTTDFTQLDNEKLIIHIINTHHSYLNEQLPFISRLASAVLRAHGKAHPELYDLYKDFHKLKTELEQHLIKEEAILFPAILSNQEEAKCLLEVQDEHEVAGDILGKLREHSQDYTVPAGGCESYEKLYQLLEALESDIFQHVHLENNILFKRL